MDSGKWRTNILTQSQVNQWLMEEIDKALNVGLKVPVERIDKHVKLTNAFNTLGTCRRINGNFSIRVSNNIINEKDIRNTLMHEILHTIDGCFNHGNKFISCGNLINDCYYGYNIKRCNCVEKKEVEYKYRAVCNGCGQEIKRMKRSNFIKYMEHYKCGKCDGKFQLI